MKFVSQLCHHLRQLPLLLLLIPTSVSLTLTRQDLQNMFQLHPARTPGACSGYSLNGVPLMPYVLTAVGDAVGTAANVKSQMDQSTWPTPSGKRMRGLLYIFFGITFGADRLPSPASEASFNSIEGARLSRRRPSMENVEFAD